MEILSPTAIRGSLVLVLHAHLPYIRYPENEQHLEESWLNEAITETYIPLLDVFENLMSDRIDFRLTISMSPPLMEMLNDSLLMDRYQKYLESRIELAEKEAYRNRNDIRFEKIADFYLKRLRKIRHLFEDVYKKNLMSGFLSLFSSGNIEVITSAATHAYLPAHMAEPSSVRTQLQLGAHTFLKYFNKKSAGIWLPECGYAQGLDSFLKETDMNFFFLESHGLLNGSPKPLKSIFSPALTPAGTIAFARDTESSKQVWNATSGYPGDSDYRDFYRDIGFDLDYEYISPYLPGGMRTFTGMKYYSVTCKSGDKDPYVRGKALNKAKIHAHHFLKAREEQAVFLGRKLKSSPVITAAYDAELFGHWWFEGPEWLDNLFRTAHSEKTALRFTTPSEYIEESIEMQTVRPSDSSWGKGGYSSTWIDDSNGWIYRHLRRASEMISTLSEKYQNQKGLTERVLNQAGRELLIAQSSDWPFMMKTGNNVEFGRIKFTEHMNNFNYLCSALKSNDFNKEKLASLEIKNNIFCDIDHRIFRAKK